MDEKEEEVHATGEVVAEDRVPVRKSTLRPKAAIPDDGRDHGEPECRDDGTMQHEWRHT